MFAGRHYPLPVLAVAMLTASVADVAGQPQVVDRPWAKNVSATQQQRARKLHHAGYKHLIQADYEPALAIFRSAVEEWDHPATRFNMAVALFQLGRSVEAYVNVRQALKHGPLPLKPAEYQRAIEIKAVLEERVTEVVVVCAEPEVRVTVDGKYLFTAPGEKRTWVTVEGHLVVGEGPRGRTMSQSFEVAAHQTKRVELPRWPIETERVLVSRWDSWKPWALAGLGAVTVLAGTPLQLRAQANMDAFDQQVAVCQEAALPCDTDAVMASLRDRSEFQNRMAISSFAVGGAMLVTGIALVILNRPRTEEVPRLVVHPVVSGERALVLGSLRF